MQNEAIEILKAIKGEIVKMRNDFLMLRVAVENIEKTVGEIKQNQDNLATPLPINGKNLLE